MIGVCGSSVKQAPVAGWPVAPSVLVMTILVSNWWVTVIERSPLKVKGLLRAVPTSGARRVSTST